MNYEDRVTKANIEAATPKIAAGTYTGNGPGIAPATPQQQTIDVGFRPKAVLIIKGGAMFEQYGALIVEGRRIALNMSGVEMVALELTDSGFAVGTVYTQYNGGTITSPYLNEMNSTYFYVAIG